jgi:hypothetical protein
MGIRAMALVQHEDVLRYTSTHFLDLYDSLHLSLTCKRAFQIVYEACVVPKGKEETKQRASHLSILLTVESILFHRIGDVEIIPTSPRKVFKYEAYNSIFYDWIKTEHNEQGDDRKSFFPPGILLKEGTSSATTIFRKPLEWANKHPEHCIVKIKLKDHGTDQSIWNTFREHGLEWNLNTTLLHFMTHLKDYPCPAKVEHWVDYKGEGLCTDCAELDDGTLTGKCSLRVRPGFCFTREDIEHNFSPPVLPLFRRFCTFLDAFFLRQS